MSQIQRCDPAVAQMASSSPEYTMMSMAPEATSSRYTGIIGALTSLFSVRVAHGIRAHAPGDAAAHVNRSLDVCAIQIVGAIVRRTGFVLSGEVTAIASLVTAACTSASTATLALFPTALASAWRHRPAPPVRSAAVLA